MKRLSALGLLLSLVLAAPAQAKEVLSAKVCGENGCATSRDRDLIAGLAEGGEPVGPPAAAAPFFRVHLTIGDDRGKVVERFWTIFMPKGELIGARGGTWTVATNAYTGALKKVVDPSMAAYPASRLEKLFGGHLAVRGFQSPGSGVSEPPRPQPGAGDGGSAARTVGLVGVGTLAAALVLLFALRRRRTAGLAAGP